MTKLGVFGASTRHRWLGIARFRRVRVAITALMTVVSLIFLAQAYYDWIELRSSAKRIAEVVENSQRLRSFKERPTTKSAPSDLRLIQRHNLAAYYLNFPWAEILGTLEQNDTALVSIISVELDIDTTELRMETEASELGALLVYAERLNSSFAGSSLSLARHELSKQQADETVRLSFVIKLDNLARDRRDGND